MHSEGIDVHRTYLTIAIVDNHGTLVREEGRVPIGDGEPMLEALEGFRPLEVVVETCSFWPWFYDTREPTEVGFHLAHARKLEEIARADTRTDTIDARPLGRMLATALIPEVYSKAASQREFCRLIRHLQQQGFDLEKGEPLTGKGRRWLRDDVWRG